MKQTHFKQAQSKRTHFLPLVGALALAVSLLSATPLCAQALDGPMVAYLPLAPEQTNVFTKLGEAALDDPATGRVPNYLRAVAASYPNAAPALAKLYKTVIYGGTVEPEIKAAMGLEIAQETGSRYLAAHLKRVLNATERGRTLLAARSSTGAADEPAKIALLYADHLSRSVHGVDDAEFAHARTVYNDAQLVELTMTTCFFNYFSRFCQGAGLPVEPWAKEAPNALPQRASESDDRARVTLATDAELQMAATLTTPSPDLKKSLGIGIANSQRAMLRVPDIASAWNSYWAMLRSDAAMARETQLQISFAVSMANGCRYCTLHQVAGLRQLGVDPAKLVAMKKNDSVLSPKELACVTYARKLTKTPSAINAADYAALRAAVGSDKEALDGLLQACTFNFMNRFTDGLRLPSEDEAVKVYQEVYGEGSYKAYLTERSGNVNR
jgi:uncharacterized peroxidase-related enzyme